MKSMCATFVSLLLFVLYCFIAVKLLNGFLTLASLFERSVFRSDSLKQKVTVGKDTLNIKKAVCCSEVGDVETMANCAQGHHPNEIITVQAFVPNNTSFVGLTGISISLFSVVQLLTVALSNTLLIQWWSDTFLRTFEQMRLEVIISTMPGNTITLTALFVVCWFAQQPCSLSSLCGIIVDLRYFMKASLLSLHISLSISLNLQLGLSNTNWALSINLFWFKCVTDVFNCFKKKVLIF